MSIKEGHINFNKEIIIRYLGGTASETDIDLLYSWIKADKKNEKEFLDFKRLWDNSGYVKEAEAINTVAAFYKFMEAKKRSENKTKGNRKERFRMVRILAISTAASLIFAVFGLLYLKEKQSHTLKVSSDNLSCEVALPDGSIVTLAPYSHITYSKKITGNVREAWMDGKVYFNIKHDDIIPFRIHVDGILVEVTGTTFCIDTKADEKELSITVETGQVRVVTDNSKQVVNPGSKAIYYKMQNTLQVIANNNINYLSWKTGKLNFRSTPLLQVVEILKETYGVSIEIVHESAKYCNLTAKFENETLENIFLMLEMAFNISLKQENGIYLLYGEGCSQ